MNTFDRVSDWNAKAGNNIAAVGTDEYYTNLYNQAGRIGEELGELYEAIATRNLQGVFDAGLDLDVVVAGANYLSGGNYRYGINAVLNNNDLKITPSLTEAEQWAEYHTAQGTEVKITAGLSHPPYVDVPDVFYSVRRKSDNKILKYENFPEVDLAPFTPAPEVVYITLARNSEVELTEFAKLFQVMTLDSIDDEESKGVMQQILDQSGHDFVRLVLKVPENEVLEIQSYEAPTEG